MKQSFSRTLPFLDHNVSRKKSSSFSFPHLEENLSAFFGIGPPVRWVSSTALGSEVWGSRTGAYWGVRRARQRRACAVCHARLHRGPAPPHPPLSPSGFAWQGTAHPRAFGGPPLRSGHPIAEERGTAARNGHSGAVRSAVGGHYAGGLPGGPQALWRGRRRGWGWGSVLSVRVQEQSERPLGSQRVNSEHYSGGGCCWQLRMRLAVVAAEATGVLNVEGSCGGTPSPASRDPRALTVFPDLVPVCRRAPLCSGSGARSPGTRAYTFPVAVWDTAGWSPRYGSPLLRRPQGPSSSHGASVCAWVSLYAFERNKVTLCAPPAPGTRSGCVHIGNWMICCVCMSVWVHACVCARVCVYVLTPPFFCVWVVRWSHLTQVQMVALGCQNTNSSADTFLVD